MFSEVVVGWCAGAAPSASYKLLSKASGVRVLTIHVLLRDHFWWDYNKGYVNIKPWKR